MICKLVTNIILRELLCTMLRRWNVEVMKRGERTKGSDSQEVDLVDLYLCFVRLYNTR